MAGDGAVTCRALIWRAASSPASIDSTCCGSQAHVLWPCRRKQSRFRATGGLGSGHVADIVGSATFELLGGLSWAAKCSNQFGLLKSLRSVVAFIYCCV